MTLETSGLQSLINTVTDSYDSVYEIPGLWQLLEQSHEISRAHRLGDFNGDGIIDPGQLAALWARGLMLDAMPQQTAESTNVIKNTDDNA